MHKEIQFTFNFGNGRKLEMDRYTAACQKLGYSEKIVDSNQMHLLSEGDLPYAVINMAQTTNETHTRYLRELELSNVRVVNSILKSRIADDKMLSYLELRNMGMPVPKTKNLHLQSNDQSVVKYVERTFEFPCVLKVHNMSHGRGIYRVDTVSQLIDLTSMIWACSARFGDYQSTSNLIVQEYMKTSVGRSIRVIVLNGECLGGMLRENTNPDDWKMRPAPVWGQWQGTEFNYAPFKVETELEKNCIKICSALGLSYAGLDIFFGDTEFIFGEINTQPSFLTFEYCHPTIQIPELVLEYLIKNK